MAKTLSDGDFCLLITPYTGQYRLLYIQATGSPIEQSQRKNKHLNRTDELLIKP